MKTTCYLVHTDIDLDNCGNCYGVTFRVPVLSSKGDVDARAPIFCEGGVKEHFPHLVMKPGYYRKMVITDELKKGVRDYIVLYRSNEHYFSVRNSEDTSVASTHLPKRFFKYPTLYAYEV